MESLKLFEKKDSKIVSTAATNLSFLYFLEGETAQADKYALTLALLFPFSSPGVVGFKLVRSRPTHLFARCCTLPVPLILPFRPSPRPSAAPCAMCIYDSADLPMACLAIDAQTT